jgi:hypothetical protein
MNLDRRDKMNDITLKIFCFCVTGAMACGFFKVIISINFTSIYMWIVDDPLNLGIIFLTGAVITICMMRLSEN